jgi:2-polyprenyl-3-methyl-5-hydroxy-6-metoxy-1,4-benzoquinol methylase
MKLTEKLKLENSNCCLGCIKNDKELFNANDLLHNLPGKYTVVKCSTCGLIRTDPRPTLETINSFYPDNYGPYLNFVVKNKEKKINNFKEFIKSIINKIFDSNGTPLPSLKPGRLLEIGCASGSFLELMNRKGWEVNGIELSEQAAKTAQKLGYKIFSGPLEYAPQPENPFDLIVGWMVLEHLHDPVRNLKKIRQWAKPKAWLVLSVPNANSLDFRLFKDKSYALQLPTHLHHFTPITIEKVLLESGWKIEKIMHQRTLNNYIASMGYLLRDRGFTSVAHKLIDFPSKGGVLTYILFPLAWLLSLVGQTGRMSVWARKCD